jgi:hypothetical protein
MDDRSPSRDEWLRLYELFGQVKQMAPWEWMDEMDLFVVKNPETGEDGYVSIMGALGEHIAVAVYLGVKGFYGMVNLANSGPDITTEDFFMIPQIQASFEDRNELKQKDRDQIKELDLKFRGRQSWPLFRSYRPGCPPWYLGAAEVRYLVQVLEQVLQVAPRFKVDNKLHVSAQKGRFLARIPHKRGQELTWIEETVTAPKEETYSIDIMIDQDAFDQIQDVEDIFPGLEVDLFMLENSIIEDAERPYFPFMLLMVEMESGYILQTALLSPLPSLEDMWGEIPNLLVEHWLEIDAIPSKIRVRLELLEGVLHPLAEMLGIDLKRSKKLRKLDRVRRELGRFLE